MNRIRELRKRRNMTQKELAEYLQIADSTLSYWEMGKYEPDNESLRKLSRFFRVPIDYILCCDISEWESDTNRLFYQSAVNSLNAGGEAYVKEPKAAYGAASEICDSTASATTAAQMNSATLSDMRTAFLRGEFEGLTLSEVDKLAEYAMFIKTLRKKDW